MINLPRMRSQRRRPTGRALHSPGSNRTPCDTWVLGFSCCRANMERIRQSRPDSGLGVQAEDLETFHGVPSSIASESSNQMLRLDVSQGSTRLVLMGWLYCCRTHGKEVEPHRPAHAPKSLQGYLAHKKTLTPQRPPYDPRHRPFSGF